VFRTIGDQPSLWESLLPAEVLRLPAELTRVDALLDDPVFCAPEWYLRLMFLKFRYRLGYESLCAEVADSISWRFCRIPLDARVPHPTTLMKLTTRCGAAAVARLNEALLVNARGALRRARSKAAGLAAAGLADAAAGRRCGRLRRAVSDLAGLPEVTRRIAAQAR
jgi:transposase, IS5 family